MKFEYLHLLPKDFSPSSHVWIYQSNRVFSLQEVMQIENLLHHFIASWNSHGSPVKGYGNLFFDQFIVLMADEQVTGVSGCSTDSSVSVVKQVEKMFNVNMFDRQSLAFVIKEKVQLLPLQQLQVAITNEFISADTLYFNNVVLTKSELESNWIIPVQDSWLAKRMALNAGHQDPNNRSL